MDFSKFANLLKPIIGKGSNDSDFARTLFMNIVNDNCDLSLKPSYESFKKYYEGSTSISSFASKIFTSIEPENFVEFLNEFEDPVIEEICITFKKYIEHIDPHNAHKEIAYYFKDIILAASSTKRKSTQKSTTNKTNSNGIKNSDNKTLIQNQINVIQNGNNNVNLTNTGTIEFNFGGANK